MTARDDIDFTMESTFGIEPHETAAFLDTYRDEVLREAATRIRRQVERRCVNDSDGDGNCAACARNPQALCRQPTLEGRAVAHAADLIDPDDS